MLCRFLDYLLWRNLCRNCNAAHCIPGKAFKQFFPCRSDNSVYILVCADIQPYIFQLQLYFFNVLPDVYSNGKNGSFGCRAAEDIEVILQTKANAVYIFSSCGNGSLQHVFFLSDDGNIFKLKSVGKEQRRFIPHAIRL